MIPCSTLMANHRPGMGWRTPIKSGAKSGSTYFCNGTLRYFNIANWEKHGESFRLAWCCQLPLQWISRSGPGYHPKHHDLPRSQGLCLVLWFSQFLNPAVTVTRLPQRKPGFLLGPFVEVWKEVGHAGRIVLSAGLDFFLSKSTAGEYSDLWSFNLASTMFWVKTWYSGSDSEMIRIDHVRILTWWYDLLVFKLFLGISWSISLWLTDPLVLDLLLYLNRHLSNLGSEDGMMGAMVKLPPTLSAKTWTCSPHTSGRIKKTTRPKE